MKVRKKAAIEYWLTAASLTLAVAILVVILGAEGGFADRVEKAAVQAQGDVVRIVVPDVEIPNRPVKTYKVFLPSELEAVRESVTMGQDVAGFHGFHLLTPLMAVLGGQPGQGEIWQVVRIRRAATLLCSCYSQLLQDNGPQGKRRAPLGSRRRGR